MIDRSTTDRIFAAANIVDVVGDFVSLKKKGVNYQACCPFHNEKTPSFVVSPTKGLFKCFGCGKGGNAVTFVMEHENLSYVDALKYVAKKYNIEIQERELSQDELRQNDDRESMMIVSSYAAEYFVNELHNTPQGQSIGLSYFQERGFSEKTIKQFELGYCPTQGDAFSLAAIAAGYKEEFLVSTGLTIKKEQGGYYDRFAGRTIFPIHGISGRVIAFGARTMRTDKKVAKYLNSPESLIYHKSNILYGLYFAKKAIMQNDNCILVEGYTDVISMHQSGVENVVASSGTSLTTEQIKLIGRFTKNITVIYDGDSAGIKASLRGIDMILKEGLNVRVVLLPEGEDPDSFARTHSQSELREFMLTAEQDFLSFKTKLLLGDAQNDPIRRAAVISDIVQSISVIPDNISRSVYTKECSRLMAIDEQVLVREVALKRVEHTSGTGAKEYIRNYETAHEQPPQVAPALKKIIAGSSIEELERELMKYLIKYGDTDFEYIDGKEPVNLNVAEVIISDLENNGISMTNQTYDDIYKEYAKLWHAGSDVKMQYFINHENPAVCEAVVDLLTYDDNYIASKLWLKHDIVVQSEQDRLPVAIPRAITLYKSKVIEVIISTLQVKLQNEQISEDDSLQIIKQISALNNERIAIARKLSRLVL